MTARLCVLGSGSSGNGSWVSLPSRDGSIECFIDAGLSPKQTGERLKRRGLLPIKPSVLVLTHADGDHWRPTWAPHVERLNMRVLARREHHAALVASGVPASRLEALPVDAATELAPGVTLDAMPTPHDEHGSTALRFESEGGRIAWLTDLGRADAAVTAFARGCEVVAIESNYCVEMQMASRRPIFLKQRIMGGKGHLSNDQCLAAVREIVGAPQAEVMATAGATGPSVTAPGLLSAAPTLSKQSPTRAATLPAVEPTPHRIVLLHLSRDCNHATRIRQLWREQVPHLCDRLVVSSQQAPTQVLEVAPRPQTLTLFGVAASA